MTWTYDHTIPEDKDRVRLYIGDTDENDPQLQDQEIELFLSDSPNALRAAYECALAIAARYARQIDTRVGAVSTHASQMQKAYEQLACNLRARMMRSGAAPVAGGRGATTLPFFRRDMMTERATEDVDLSTS